MELGSRHSRILIAESFSYVVLDPSYPSWSRSKIIFSVFVSDGQSRCIDEGWVTVQIFCLCLLFIRIIFFVFFIASCIWSQRQAVKQQSWYVGSTMFSDAPCPILYIKAPSITCTPAKFAAVTQSNSFVVYITCGPGASKTSSPVFSRMNQSSVHSHGTHCKMLYMCDPMRPKHHEQWLHLTSTVVTPYSCADKKNSSACTPCKSGHALSILHQDLTVACAPAD